MLWILLQENQAGQEREEIDKGTCAYSKEEWREQMQRRFNEDEGELWSANILIKWDTM